MQIVFEKWAELIWRMSWQTAVLVVLVLLAQFLLKRQLAPRWRYALWLLVVGRLLVPVLPSSPASIFNLQPALIQADAGATELPVHAAAEPLLPHSFSSPMDQPEVFPPTESPSALTSQSPSAIQPPQPLPAPETPFNYLPWLLGGWLAGVLIFGARVLSSSLSLLRTVSGLNTHTGDAVSNLLQRCKEEMGVTRNVQLLESPAVLTPALYGFFTPRLLLPVGLGQRFTEQELRFVFLHELAHVKRHDIAMNWLLTLLQVLHWFNPFIWLAFARLRADRELACDAMALECAGEQENRSYGATVIKLVEEFSCPAAVPNMVGILEDKTQMQQRIRMILGFRRTSRWPVIAVALMSLLAIITLTDAQLETPPANPNPFTTLDLKPVFNTFEMADWVNMNGCFAVVPRGRTNLGGIEFQCDGLIQLLGVGPQQDGRRFREQVRLPLGTNRFAAIHILGGMGWMDAPHGTTVAEFVLTYDDGTTARLPIQAGVHMKDWFRLRYEDPPGVSSPDSRVAWRGTHPTTDAWGKSLRLWCTSLENPHRQKKVASIDLVSAMAFPNLFVTGITLDSRSFDERPFPAPDLDLDQPPLTGRLDLLVLDAATGLPIPGVEILSWGSESIGKPGYGIYKKTIQTDSTGTALLPVSENNLEKLELRLSKSGYSGWRKVWETAQGDSIPAQLEIRLQPGTLIGGTVLDPFNTPIPKVEISIARIYRGGESSEDRNKPSQFTSTKTTTDALGQWTSQDVPANLLDKIRLSFSHPDFAKTNQLPDASASGTLQDRTWTTVLAKGAEITGWVSDQSGRPVPDAKVAFGRRYHSNRQETTTDAAGRFRLENLAQGSPLNSETEVLTVTADHFAPEVQTIPYPPGPEEIHIVLSPGATIRGRVVDARGNPLPRVRVVRESRQPGSGDSIEWQTETDSEGRFTWKGAPNEAQSFYFGRGGFGQLREVKLQPGETEHLITLPDVRKLSGRITDATTGQPVSNFRVLPAKGDAHSLHSWSDSSEQSFQNPQGAFELEITEAEHNVVRITAEGYLLQNVLLPAPTDNEMRIAAALEPVEALAGHVLDPNGAPIANVQVALIGSGNDFYLRLKDKQLVSQRANPLLTTSDANGHFTLSPPSVPSGLVAVHETGFAEVTLAAFQQNPTLVLQPWGRIEGELQSPNPAGLDLALQFDPPGAHRFLHLDFNAYKITTDASGHFAFEDVPPGTRSIVRLIRTTPRSWIHSHATVIEVLPGQTTRVAMGGDTSPVTGKIQWPDQRSFTNFYVTASLATPQPGPFLSPEAHSAWLESEEGRNFYRHHRNYAFTVASNGAFTTDVPPGEYRLNVGVSEAPQNGEFFPGFGKTIARLEASVTIPEPATPGASFDLGVFTLEPAPQP